MLITQAMLDALPEHPYPHPRGCTATFRDKTATAYYRLFSPWYPEEEWFLLAYDTEKDVLLCYRRTEYFLYEEVLYKTPGQLESYLGPQYQNLLLDGSFEAQSMGGL